MNLQEAHDLMDLLLDKADQPYFTEDEKNMFLDQAIASYINNHYQLYEQEQVSRDALASFLYYEEMNNTNTDWVSGVIRLPSDYVHIIQVSLAYNTTTFSEGKQAKIIGLKDYYERNYSSDPFNKATEEHPIAYVRQDGTSIFVGYFPQIPVINNALPKKLFAPCANLLFFRKFLSYLEVYFGLPGTIWALRNRILRKMSKKVVTTSNPPLGKCPRVRHGGGGHTTKMLDNISKL